MNEIRCFELSLGRGVVGLVLVVLILNVSCISSNRKDVLVVHNGLDVSYAGKHREHPQIRQLFENFPDIRRNVYHKIRRRTGLWPKNGWVIVVRLEDRQWRHGNAIAWMSPRIIGRKDGVLLNFYTDALIAMPGVFKDVLAHETIHAVMYQLMGGRRFWALEKWVKEGAASWGAGEVPARLRTSVCYRKRSADQILDGLERRAYEDTFHQGQDYLEDALAFDYVARIHGMDAVRQLYGFLVSGLKVEAAFEEATGLSWGVVQEKIDGYARQAIAQVDCKKQRNRSIGIQDLLRSGDYAQARDQLQEFLSRFPESPKAPQALLWLGHCHLALRSLSQALTVFERAANHRLASDVQKKRAHELAERIRQGQDKNGNQPEISIKHNPGSAPNPVVPKPEPLPEPSHEIQLDLVPPTLPQQEEEE